MRAILLGRLFVFVVLLVPGLRLLLRRRCGSYALLGLTALELLLLGVMLLLHALQLLLLLLLDVLLLLLNPLLLLLNARLLLRIRVAALLQFLLLLNLTLFDLLAFKILALTELFELLILFLFQLRIDVVVVVRRARIGRPIVVLPIVIGVVRRSVRHIVCRRRSGRGRRAIYIVVLLLLNIAVVLLRDIAIVLLLDIAIVEIWLRVLLIVRLIRLHARISRLHWHDSLRPWSYAYGSSRVILRRSGLDLAHLRNSEWPTPIFANGSLLTIEGHGSRRRRGACDDRAIHKARRRSRTSRSASADYRLTGRRNRRAAVCCLRAHDFALIDAHGVASYRAARDKGRPGGRGNGAVHALIDVGNVGDVDLLVDDDGSVVVVHDGALITRVLLTLTSVTYLRLTRILRHVDFTGTEREPSDVAGTADRDA